MTNLVDPAVPDLELHLEGEELLVDVSEPVNVRTEKRQPQIIILSHQRGAQEPKMLSPCWYLFTKLKVGEQFVPDEIYPIFRSPL